MGLDRFDPCRGAARRQAGPVGRWLLCRPRGGFTDTLVQIDHARAYALRHDRAIALDLEASGVKARFDRLFRVADSFGCRVVPLDPALAARFDACPSVRPAELRHRLSHFEARYRAEPTHNYVDADTGVPITFDRDRDHAEQVLVHSQCGGGPNALRLLRHLRLVPDVADEVARRIAGLGPRYAAVHVRHTDYEADYLPLFGALRRRRWSMPLALCTDNPEVAATAERLLSDVCDLRRLVDLPPSAGAPLHVGRVADARAYAIDLLTDLLALASASRLYAAPLLASGGRRRYSGFSVLALQLRLFPAVLDGLFALGDPDLAAARRAALSARPFLDDFLPDGTPGRDGPALRHALSVWNKSRRVLRKDVRPSGGRAS